MNLLTKLRSLIATVGVNPDFIAFNAHAGFAYAIVHTFGVRLLPVVLVVAAVKEFWFDANYEVPKQTTQDNVTDFVGYATGAFLALLAILATHL
jgi:hypothetical protein